MRNCRIPLEKLHHGCDPEQFAFETTEQLDSLEGMIGQERAVRAMEFGLRVRSSGYNVYMSGPAGTGRTTYARSVTRQLARNQSPPQEWIYVHNFQDPDRPLAIGLPPGVAPRLRDDMEALVDDLQSEIPKAFDSEHYEEQRQAAVHEFQARTEAMFEELEQYARSQGFQLRRTGAGFATIPLKDDAEPMSQEEFNALPEEERDRLEDRSRTVQMQVTEALRKVRGLEKEAKDRLRQLDRELALTVVEPLVARVREKYAPDGQPEPLGAHFRALQEDVLQHLDDLRGEREEQQGPEALVRAARGSQDSDPLARYRVNVLVHHADSDGAPVVVETHPVYYNLIGKQEYAGQMSSVSTDFTMVKAGALHRANGGYLILQARDVLSNPPSWDALKRALKTGEISIESMGEQYRMVPIRTMRPQPIPLDVKVVLIGTPALFRLLHQVDEDFRKLFKIKADFDTEMTRDQETTHQYAMFISSLCRREGLRHFDRGGVARVVEYSSRLAADQTKITTRFNDVVEILYEAAVWAERAGAEYVGADQVEKAIEERTFRNNRVEERIRELVTRDKLLIETEGEAAGQVNGLSVVSVGEYAFGRPSRITARAFMGDKGVVNIEREIELSGSIHDKGVLTLAGYLGAKYAQRMPLALSASITFEQMYDGVDGDSASSAELYALLSSLSGLPLRQDLAVTGSVDQNGRIQPIGGANQKIEGYFRVCEARGLTGRQGVLIPVQNVDTLMLHREVIDAVARGAFHVYAVADVDEGLELLTGVPAGEASDDGVYPSDSVHGRVAERLRAYAEGVAAFGRRGGGDGGRGSRRPGG